MKKTISTKDGNVTIRVAVIENEITFIVDGIITKSQLSKFKREFASEIEELKQSINKVVTVEEPQENEVKEHKAVVKSYFYNYRNVIIKITKIGGCIDTPAEFKQRHIDLIRSLVYGNLQTV